MSISDFNQATSKVYGAQDAAAAKKAFKDAEKALKKVERSRYVRQSVSNAYEGINMYLAMKDLCQSMGMPNTAQKYYLRAQDISEAIQSGKIKDAK